MAYGSRIDDRNLFGAVLQQLMCASDQTGVAEVHIVQLVILPSHLS